MNYYFIQKNRKRDLENWSAQCYIKALTLMVVVSHGWLLWILFLMRLFAVNLMEIVQKKENGEVKNQDTNSWYQNPHKGDEGVYLKCHNFTLLEKRNLCGICTFFCFLTGCKSSEISLIWQLTLHLDCHYIILFLLSGYMCDTCTLCPASCSNLAAVNPAIPAPTITTWWDVFMCGRPVFAVSSSSL